MSQTTGSIWSHRTKTKIASRRSGGDGTRTGSSGTFLCIWSPRLVVRDCITDVWIVFILSLPPLLVLPAPLPPLPPPSPPSLPLLSPPRPARLAGLCLLARTSRASRPFYQAGVDSSKRRMAVEAMQTRHASLQATAASSAGRQATGHVSVRTNACTLLDSDM